MDSGLSVSKANRRRKNIDILLEALGEQQTIIRREQPLPLLELPKTDQVIVHLRLGDGLCGDERWDNKLVCGEQRPTNAGRFRNCWKHDYDCFFYHGNRYAYSQRWYDTIASDLTSAASEISSNVSIVSDARHWTRAQDRRKGNYSVDKKCRQEIASFLRGLGFTSIEFRNSEETHNSPDQDFAYLCSAKVFVPSGGGYSRLAAQVVERRGGMVIKPKDPDKELPMVQLSGKNHTDVIQVVSEMVDLSISGKNISAPFYAANSSAYFLAVDQEIGPVSRIWNDTEDGQDTLRIPLSAIGCEAVRNETVVAAIGGQQRQPDGSMWQMGAGRSANNLGRATSWQIAAGRSANNLGQGYTLGHSLVLKLKNTTFNPWLEQTKYVGCAFRSPDEVVINAYRWHDPNAGMFIGKLALNFTVKVPRGKDHG